MKIIKISIVAFLILLTNPAYGAEASLPVKVTLVRCVTQAERAALCEERQMCCTLVAPDQLAESTLNPKRKAGPEFAVAKNGTPAELTLE